MIYFMDWFIVRCDIKGLECLFIFKGVYGG